MQLLPNGQLIVLMADHQTTGGYPRIGCVTSADLSILAQRSASDAIRFAITDIQTAERKLMEQNTYLNDILLSCKYKLEAYL
jgi:antagonist of KipI